MQGGCQVFDEAFSSILDELKAAKTIEEYYTGAAKLQDYYAAHMPLIALYWDNMMLAYSSKAGQCDRGCRIRPEQRQQLVQHHQEIIFARRRHTGEKVS